MSGNRSFWSVGHTATTVELSKFLGCDVVALTGRKPFLATAVSNAATQVFCGIAIAGMLLACVFFERQRHLLVEKAR